MGDTDADVSIDLTKIKNLDAESGGDLLDSLIQRLNVDNMVVIDRRIEKSPRDMLQIFDANHIPIPAKAQQQMMGTINRGALAHQYSKQPHLDIWIYKESKSVTKNTDEMFLVNYDYTVRSQEIPMEYVYPIDNSSFTFLDLPVGMPSNPQAMSKMEYGPSFMTPLTTKFECMENFINGFTFYQARGQFFTWLFTIVAFTAAITFATLKLLMKTLWPWYFQRVRVLKAVPGRYDSKWKFSKLPSRNA